MNKYTKKYKKIVDKLVNKSFPELNKKLICVISTKIQFGKVFASMTYLGFMTLIIVFPLAKSCSSNELKSILAHELSHFEIILNMSFFEKISFAFKWLFTKKGKSNFETAADKYAIAKGYARGLFSKVKKTEKERTNVEIKERIKKGYLSPKQIKSYAQKIKKW